MDFRAYNYESKKISFGNFKSLYNVSFEPGKINVFIGANGSGKSTILEGIGLLSAAMTDRVDAVSLQRKGVRLCVPALYKSTFKSIGRLKSTVNFSLEWDDGSSSDIYQYDVHLMPPTDTEYFKYQSEAFFAEWNEIMGAQQQIVQAKQ